MRLDRAARSAGAADFLRRRAAADMAERLASIVRTFPLGVEIGARGGELREALADIPPRIETLIEADLSLAQLRSRPGLRVVLDEERLPFAAESLDVVLSTLALHWTNDLPGVLAQIRRALKPDGLFLATLIGGASLNELRWALTQAEVEVTGGAGPRVSPFAGAYDGASLLQRAGFALPVTDVDTVTVRYANPLSLLRDLRAMGETNVLFDRPRRPLSKPVIARALELYGERYADADGRVPATFEIITLTGWAPHESQPKPLKPGSAKVRLADALKTREHGAGERPG